MGSLVLLVSLVVVAVHGADPETGVAARSLACQRAPVLVSFGSRYTSALGYEVRQVVLRHLNPRTCGGRRIRVRLTAPSVLLAQRTVRAPRHRSTVTILFTGVRAEDVTGIRVSAT